MNKHHPAGSRLVLWTVLWFGICAAPWSPLQAAPSLPLPSLQDTMADSPVPSRATLASMERRIKRALTGVKLMFRNARSTAGWIPAGFVELLLRHRPQALPGKPYSRGQWENSPYYRQGLVYREGLTEWGARYMARRADAEEALRADNWDYRDSAWIGVGKFLGRLFDPALVVFLAWLGFTLRRRIARLRRHRKRRQAPTQHDNQDFIVPLGEDDEPPLSLPELDPRGDALAIGTGEGPWYTDPNDRIDSHAPLQAEDVPVAPSVSTPPPEQRPGPAHQGRGEALDTDLDDILSPSAGNKTTKPPAPTPASPVPAPSPPGAEIAAEPTVAMPPSGAADGDRFAAPAATLPPGATPAPGETRAAAPPPVSPAPPMYYEPLPADTQGESESLHAAEAPASYDPNQGRSEQEMLEGLANQGNAHAQLRLGRKLLRGIDLERNREQGLYWIRKAAQQGLAEAQLALAESFLRGEGVTKDPEKATHWVRLAAEQGNGPAEYLLAKRLFHGKGVRRDPSEAAHWLEKAAHHGVVEAKFNLGILHCRGIGVPKHYQTALNWLKEAGEDGDTEAGTLLVEAYSEGWLGLPADSEQAVYWRRKSGIGALR